jgi:hypothetical protein
LHASKNGGGNSSSSSSNNNNNSHNNNNHNHTAPALLVPEGGYFGGAGSAMDRLVHLLRPVFWRHSKVRHQCCSSAPKQWESV